MFLKGKIRWILFLIFLCFGILFFYESSTGPMVLVMTSEGKSVEFKVAVADTPELYERGLQHVDHLGNDQGMWFVFDAPRETAFWMKDTLIPLDIIFVDSVGKIRVIYSVPPCFELDPEQVNCPSYFSGGLVSNVLEIPEGVAQARGIKVGDSVTFK